MFTTEPILLTPGDFKRHHKEAENLWLYRLLEMSPRYPLKLYGETDDGRLIVSRDEEKIFVSVPEARRQAFMAWFSAKLNQVEAAKEASVLVISDAELRHFLLQRKDNNYPREDGCERYALIGGRAFVDEDPRHTMLRELYEEIRNLELADELAGHLFKVGQLDEEDGSFRWHAYLTMAERESQFWRWAEMFLEPQALAESLGAYMDRDLFNRLAEHERRDPGKYFLRGEHRLIWKAF